MISWKLSGSPEYCIFTMSESSSQAILAALPMFSGVCALVSSKATGIGSIIIGRPASCATEMMFRVRARLSGTDVLHGVKMNLPISAPSSMASRTAFSS